MSGVNKKKGRKKYTRLRERQEKMMEHYAAGNMDLFTYQLSIGAMSFSRDAIRLIDADAPIQDDVIASTNKSTNSDGDEISDAPLQDVEIAYDGDEISELVQEEFDNNLLKRVVDVSQKKLPKKVVKMKH